MGRPLIGPRSGRGRGACAEASPAGAGVGVGVKHVQGRHQLVRVEGWYDDSKIYAISLKIGYALIVA